MPGLESTIDSGIKKGAIAAFLSKPRELRAHADETPTPRLPITEHLSHTESDLQSTADHIRHLVWADIRSLSSGLPVGESFKSKGVVFLETGEGIDNQGKRGEKVITVDTHGEMHMWEPTERNDRGEWDLDCVGSRPVRDEEVIRYTLPLMAKVEERLEKTLMKALISDQIRFGMHPEETRRESATTVFLSKDLGDIKIAILDLSQIKFLFVARNQQLTTK
jgi:hypothetical protein